MFSPGGLPLQMIFLMFIVGVKFKCVVWSKVTMARLLLCVTIKAAGEKLVQKLSEKLGDNKSEHAEKLVASKKC